LGPHGFDLPTSTPGKLAVRPFTRDDRVVAVPAVLRATPALDALVELPAGRYTLGEPGEERVVELASVLIGRYPVVNTSAPQLAGHPATDVTLAEAEAYCAAIGARLPSADEWEALARGTDARAYPWGDTFDETRCNCVEAGWGWTVPVTAHPGGASPFGAEQLAGNVWEWVSDRTPDGWGVVKGGSYLDMAWGLRACRALPADPARPTRTTGFRIAIEPRRTA
jgi:formylglycine-generating enzyme required for sulfatase activity